MVPVGVDRHRKVVFGTGRVLAAKDIGLEEVPTVALEHLSEAQIHAFRIADNRLSEMSVWDDRLLAEQLQQLAALDLDFDLEAIGFDMGEIDFRIQSLETNPRATEDPADDVPASPAEVPSSRAGDCWHLGRHRVYCGSALDSAAYTTLLGKEKAGVVFVDPPYNVPIDGHVSGKGKTRHREFAMASGEMSRVEFTVFLLKSCSLLAQHSREGAVHFVCMDWRHVRELLTATDAAGLELLNLCVWAKENSGMGSLYRSQHELVFVYKNGRARHENNVELGKHGRHRSNVWRYPGVNSFGRPGEEGNLAELHPTIKPVALVADAILDCSARGDIVLDAFLGSGTTVIAAERTGRRCYGMELDPIYVDTTIRRWQAFTGDVARHGESGQSFAETAAEREAEHVR